MYTVFYKLHAKRIEIHENSIEFLVSLDTKINPVVMLEIFFVLDGIPPVLIGVDVVSKAIFVIVLTKINVLVGSIEAVLSIAEVIGSFDLALEVVESILVVEMDVEGIGTFGTGNVMSDGNGSI